MRTGKDRVQVEAMGGTGKYRRRAGGRRRHPARRLGRDRGIPRAHEDAMLAAAEEIDAVEERIRDAVQGGMKLREARIQHGYHKLQSRAR